MNLKINIEKKKRGKMKKQNKNTFSNKINSFLDIPSELSYDKPKITIVGFDQMLIENYKGILEYDDFYIKINTIIGNININGFKLNIKQVTEDDMIICGIIESFDIDRIVDEDN